MNPVISRHEPSARERAWLDLAERLDLPRAVLAMRLEGDSETIRARLTEIADRHELLRARYVRDGKRIFRESAEPGTLAWHDHGKGTDPILSEIARADKSVHGMAAHRYGDLLVMTFPVATVDRRSLLCIERELEGGLEKVPTWTQYGRYTDKLSENTSAAKDYWAHRLAASKGSVPLSMACAGRPESGIVTVATGRRYPDPVQAEKAVLGAWLDVLEAHGDSSPPTIGVLLDGVGFEKLARLIGPLACYLPLTVGDGALDERLAGHREWQDYFGLEGERMPSCEAGFSFHAEGPVPEHIEALVTPHLPLHLEAFLETGRLGFVFRHDASRYNEPTVRLLARRLIAVLEGGSARKPVPDTDDMTLLRRLNDTATDLDTSRDVITRFEDRAAARPDTEALVCGETRITYGALDEAANRLANHLLELGAAIETPVAVHLDRGIEVVIAFLAVMKTGGYYIPLDPLYPEDRLQYMLEDSGATLLVTSGAELAVPEEVARIDLVEQNEQIAVRPAMIPKRNKATLRSAYVIYTSGSTGRPKGVQIAHEALTNFLLSMSDSPGIGEHDALLAVTTVCFDISGLELYAPLINGGRLVLADTTTAKDAHRLAELIEIEHVTVMQATPVTWKLLFAIGWKGHPSLKVLCGGEAFPRDLALRLVDVVDSVWNMYGPTETTIWSACRRLDRDFLETLPEGAAVTLGPPIANTELHVVDDAGQLGALAREGELLIGGAGLARGYFRRPGLTADRFTPDPFSGRSGARLYGTGDQACFQPDGELTFIGRRDGQIKLRGYRVELGEVEAVMRRQPGITDAAAKLWQEPRAEIVAYLSGEAVDIEAVRSALLKALPEYMVPTGFEVMDALPLTPNGKLDRERLPEPGRSGGGEGGTAPTNPTESGLLDLWRNLLHAEALGIDDDFFEAGGHSLNGTIMMFRIAESMGLEATLGDLYAAPTVRALARFLHASLLDDSTEAEGLDDGALYVRVADRLTTSATEERGIPPIPRTGPGQAFALSHAQRRLYMHEITEENPSGTYNVPGAVRLRGPLDIAALTETFQQIEARHESLRTVFGLEGATPIQRVMPPAARSIPFHDLSDKADRDGELRRLLDQDATAPFDLTEGPVWRTQLIRLAESEHVLTITFHHICADGWSLTIFLDEMATIYGARVRDREVTLEPLPLQYVDFAAWEAEQSDSGRWDRERRFWKQALAGAPTTPFLETDKPRPEHARFDKGGMIQLAFTPEQRTELEALAQAHEASLFQVMLTAYLVCLRAFTERDDLLVGTDVANRNRRDTDGIIGFFVNQLVMRASVAPDQPLTALLDRVRDWAFEAYRHQDLPFDEVIADQDLPRTPGYAPLFQVKFFLEHVAHRSLSLEGLSLEPLETDPGAARLDLTMGLRDDGETITGFLNYNSDLFEQTTPTAICAHYQRVVDALISEEDKTVSELNKEVAERERAQSSRARDRRREGIRKRGREGRGRRRVTVSGEQVTKTPLNEGVPLPLVISPTNDLVDLVTWARANRTEVEGLLREHGAILFRGFENISRVEVFEACAHALIDQIYTRNREHQPITDDGAVQIPVDYAADQHLLWHNENTFNHSFPRKIMFGCAIPAATGGETPLVDSRAVFRQIDPAIRDRFVEKGIIHMRNYSDQLGLSWRTIFGTDDRAEVEAKCRQMKMDFTWRDGDRLTTRALRPAAIRHPESGEMTWSNQAQHWHISCLHPETRASIEKLYAEEDYPRNAYYGDGSPIEDEAMAHILEVYARNQVAFPWQKGDLVLVENMLAAHSRNPYTGDRKLLVSMGDMISYDEIQ